MFLFERLQNSTPFLAASIWMQSSQQRWQQLQLTAPTEIWNTIASLGETIENKSSIQSNRMADVLHKREN